MNPKEIRIGNWINTIEGPVQVTAMSHEGLMATSIMTAGDLLGWAEPITITDEWLRKFDFEYCDDGVYVLFNTIDGTSNFEVVLEKSGRAYASIDGECTYWGKGFYIHQLQNLYFALTGNELIIQ